MCFDKHLVKVQVGNSQRVGSYYKMLSKHMNYHCLSFIPEISGGKSELLIVLVCFDKCLVIVRVGKSHMIVQVGISKNWDTFKSVFDDQCTSVIKKGLFLTL